MYKAILLAASALAVTPAIAQEAPPHPGAMQPQEMRPVEQSTTITTEQEATPAPQEGQTAPEEATAPVESVQQTEPAQPAAEPAQPAEAAQAAEPAEARPAESQVEVAAVVGREFPKYDADSSGALDKTEFATWMTALRKAAEPAYQEGSAEAVAWNDKAFAQADLDKNATVNSTELTVFLTPKAS